MISVRLLSCDDPLFGLLPLLYMSVDPRSITASMDQEGFRMKEYHLTPECAVRYLDLPGENPPIVFVHGLGCASSFEYPAVATQPPLKRHRAILIDLLGAGYSDRPSDFGYAVEDHAAYLNEMLISLGLVDIILFGHSLGGAVAICLSGLLKARLRQLILTESNLDPSITAIGSTSRKIASQPFKKFIERGYGQMLSSAKRKNPLWGATFAHWLPAAVWRISCSAARGGSPSWRQQLYDLPKPKAFLIGERTPPSGDAETLRANGVRVEIIPNAGHAMALENTLALASTMARLISDVEEQGA